MKIRNTEYDVVVIGGGLAGFCAAVASARNGAKTCLVQDRPVFGGNSSSEIRVTPHGSAAFHAYARETGIISELLIEERFRNHETIFENGWTNSVWDLVMYDLAMQTPNLAFHVNSQVYKLLMDDGQEVSQSELPNDSRGYWHRPACNCSRLIRAVIARVGNAELELVIKGKVFIDCTGDGVVADLAGCEWRMGSEGYEEFHEPHAPSIASKDTMGNSIHFKTRDMGQRVSFVPPDWAVKHENASYFYDQGRLPKDIRGGYWWLEIGVPWDTIYQAEDIRHELTRHCLGVWDWIKNKDPKTKELAANYALDWIGQVPGKRESRRIVGRYFMNEHDIQKLIVFNDEIAFGGWFLDLHTPGGLLAPTSEPCSAEGYSQKSAYAVKSYVGPYGLPLSALISKDVDNLMMAGRNISLTHAALGTVRVMGTTALMGQAAGTAAAKAIATNHVPYEFSGDDIFSIQQQLLREGCFLLNYRNQDPRDFARQAKVCASSEASISNVGPQTQSNQSGLSIWKDQVQATNQDRLTSRRGQFIAIASNRIDQISIYVSNHSGKSQFVDVWIVPVKNIWDYRIDTDSVLAQGKLKIPPGVEQWIEWSVNIPVTPGQYVRLDMGENSEVKWHSSEAIEPGHLSAYQIGPGKMRRYGNGVTLCYRIVPSQPCFEASNVISGITRPFNYTNLWRSDPKQSLPQWLMLDWDSPKTISSVEITFPGHLIREYHAYGPMYRDPQCPMDYRIEALVDGSWQTICQLQGNYQRRCVHNFKQTVTAKSIRVVIDRTNGDPSAAIYEVRAY